jgi:biotin operon repressor
MSTLARERTTITESRRAVLDALPDGKNFVAVEELAEHLGHHTEDLLKHLRILRRSGCAITHDGAWSRTPHGNAELLRTA